ncbi:hypothetical protein OHC33_006175 [Knufia fluminis]|uniref:Uncharacterized protein n=1 Tax=Knufia fluminis TaxID=191047 RepID=A0AAN8EJ38_9EURO|nr:hypothetical protein OHC33_006175 [Knufia fluminis]
MPGNVYPSIEVREHGQVLAGDQHNHIENHGQLFVVDAGSIDTQRLIQQLAFTTAECAGLRSVLPNANDGNNTNSRATSLRTELDELESLLESLRFHLEDDGFKTGEGWQGPISKLASTINGYCEALQLLRVSVSANTDSDLSSVDSETKRLQLRDLRLQLSIAISMSSHNASKEQIQALDTRLRMVLEEVENEKAARLEVAQPLTATFLRSVESNRSLLLRRHLAQSFDDDRDTIRAASMQVSTVLANTDAESAVIQHQDSRTDDEHTYPSEQDEDRRWVLISCMEDVSPDAVERFRCELRVKLADTVFKIKIVLLQKYGPMIGREWTAGGHMYHPELLRLFCGFAAMDDSRPARVYLDNKAYVARIICYPATRFLEPETQCICYEPPVPIHVTRDLMRRQSLRKGKNDLQSPVIVHSLGTDISHIDKHLHPILPEVLALVTIGMIYSDQRGKHTAILAYFSAKDLLREHVPLPLSVSSHVYQIYNTLDGEIERLRRLQCWLPVYVHATRPHSSTSINFQTGEELRVLDLLEDSRSVKVMRRSDEHHLLEAAYDMSNGWVPW